VALVNVFKCTAIFQGRTRGWTESLWYQGASDDHRLINKPFDFLLKARAALLAQPCLIKGYRISLEGAGPDALLSYQTYNAPPVPSGQSNRDSLFANDPDSSLLVRCSIANFSKWKFIFLRGHPDYIFTRNGTYTPDAAWNQKFASWVDRLTTAQWGWVGVDPAAKVNKIPVVGWATDPVSGVTTVTFGDNLFPAGLNPNQLVRIRIAGANSSQSPANNVWVGYPLTPTTFKTSKAAAFGIFRTNGIASYTPLKFIQIINVEDQKYAERKAGAPLLESRGRARNKARG
jgi:hypothetical protein